MKDGVLNRPAAEVYDFVHYYLVWLGVDLQGGQRRRKSPESQNWVPQDAGVEPQRCFAGFFLALEEEG